MSRLVVLLGIVSAVLAQNWALIVAGSNGYYNYRHQADVCHAYQMFREHGFPESNIISMMYDDIAQNPSNPYKGNIINHVGGPNVYPGSDKIDYKGKDVTAANFLKILAGDKASMKGIGSGKVVASGPDDNIFVFYSDHGSPGIVAFPSGGYLYATDLNNVIKKMYDQRKYNQMVLYIEACESGSMFDKLLAPNLNVYATTASNPTESSWACYWDSTRNAYLGDTYSVNFLEDSDKADMSSETFQQQYEIIKKLTTQSHVMQYGDLGMTTQTLDDFLVYGNDASTPAKCPAHLGEQVSSRDVKISTLYHMLSAAEGAEVYHIMREINEENVHRIQADRKAAAISHKLTGNSAAMLHKPVAVNNVDCLKSSVQAFEETCGRFSDYSIQHVRLLVNLCNEGVSPVQIKKAAESIC